MCVFAAHPSHELKPSAGNYEAYKTWYSKQEKFLFAIVHCNILHVRIQVVYL